MEKRALISVTDKKDLKNFDIIINTIPAKIIKDEMLDYFNDDADGRLLYSFL